MIKHIPTQNLVICDTNAEKDAYLIAAYEGLSMLCKEDNKLHAVVSGQFKEVGGSGSQGPQGVQGIPGEAGPQGIQGIQGDPGPAGISDAPSDGKIYVRRNGAWEELVIS